MSRRKVTTAVTLSVLLVVLVAMAVVGFKALTAPLPEAGSGGEECSPVEKDVKKWIARGEVQVSVFNASNRSGLAGSTLDRFERTGFKAGNAGNAPEDVRVPRALVWTSEPDDPAALLVARTLGRRVQVEVTETDLGPGVDVLVGNRFRGLAERAPKRIRLPAPVETCIDVQ